MTIQQKLTFSFPSEEEAKYLCGTKEAFHKYKLSLAYITDYLSHFVDYYTRPDFTTDEAIQHINAIVDEPILKPLKSHVQINQSIVMDLSALWEKEPEVAQSLIFQYLDDMNRWSVHLLKAFRENDFTIVKKFLKPENRQTRSEMISPDNSTENQGRNNQHVVRRETGWAVRGAGNTRDTVRTRTQKDAIERARSIARRQGSEVIVHGRDGKIRDRNSYGNDPNPPKG